MNIIDTKKIADFLASHNLSSGLGTAEEPCSMAAINLALTGRLTDDVPECMSPTIGEWIIGIQDSMPDKIRNSSGWKALLPLAAGTGRDPALEQQRVALLMDWMWSDVLPQLQPLADAKGFGEPWRTMLAERTGNAARKAESAAWAATASPWSARSTARAARAAEAAEAAAEACASATTEACASARLGSASMARAAWSEEAAAAAEACASATTEACASARLGSASMARAAWSEEAEEAGADFWGRVDPVKTLRRLVDLRGGEA